MLQIHRSQHNGPLSEQCPECMGETDVVDSRIRKFGRYRRRVCRHCATRYNTIEVNAEHFERLVRLETAYNIFKKTMHTTEEQD